MDVRRPLLNPPHASGFDFQCLVLTGTCLSLHDTFHTCARIIRDRTGLNRIVSRTRVTFSRQFQPFRFHEYFINDFLFVFQRFGAFSFVFFFFYFDLFETVNRADTIRIRNRINSEQEENIDRIIEYFIVPIYFFFFSSFSFYVFVCAYGKARNAKA